MAEISYINPLSNEGREIIKKYGDLNQLEKEDEYLIEEVIHTTNQKISDDSLIPKSYKDLAFKRMRWAIEKNRHGPSDLEWKHKFFGAAYSFLPDGEPVSEESSWQRERKKTQSEISAVNMANAVRDVLEKKE